MPNIHRNSYWNATARASDFPVLTGTHEADVVVIGAGIVGVTVARLLTDRGLKVVVVEARRVGEEVTGKSTAKITAQHGLALTKIAGKFGEDGAAIYAEANLAGLQRILELTEQHRIDCNMERKPSFTYTGDPRHVGDIEKEVELAQRLGLPVALTTEVGLPFAVRAAMRWDDQAQFHPTRYTKGLAATLSQDGCQVYERSRVMAWEGGGIETEQGSVRAEHVVMATHLPLGKTGMFFAQNHPHMHPVIMGRADPARVPDGMYISVESPRRSVRGHRDDHGQAWLVCTGSSFGHGQVDQEREAFADLERFARDHFGVSSEYRWTNEDYASIDHAPYIGWSSGGDDAVLVATGFNAWGITTGTAAAMIIADLAEGRSNRWLDLFDARRIKPVAGAKSFVTGNVKVAADLVGGRLARKPDSYAELGRGEAAVVKVDSKNVAAFRDEDGRLHAVSAVCTHMGCLVGWNETDSTWDCPCHGSRFDRRGEVVHGPAVTALAPVRINAHGVEGADEAGIQG